MQQSMTRTKHLLLLAVIILTTLVITLAWFIGWITSSENKQLTTDRLYKQALSKTISFCEKDQPKRDCKSIFLVAIDPTGGADEERAYSFTFSNSFRSDVDTFMYEYSTTSTGMELDLRRIDPNEFMSNRSLKSLNPQE